MHCQEIRQQLAIYRELGAAERDRLQEHLSTCLSCTTTLAAYTAQDQLLSALPKVVPSPALAEAVHARTTGRRQAAPGFSWQRAFAMLSLLLCLSVAWGTVSRASEALPGDLLYPVKRGAEQVRLALLLDPAVREEYQQHLAETRRAEVEEVIQQGRAVRVEFQGRLVEADAELWQVDGLQVQVFTHAWAGAPLPEGSMLAIEAQAASGQLTALRVRLLKPAVPTPVPQGSPAETRSPSRTPTARQHSGEATARPSPSPSMQPSGTPGTWGPGPQPSATSGAWGPGPQLSVTPGASGPGPQPSGTPGSAGPGPQPSVTPGTGGPGPRASATPGTARPGPQSSATPDAGGPGAQPTTTPGATGPGPHATVTPGAGEPTTQPTTTPGTIGPGPHPTVTPGAGEPTTQPTTTPGTSGPGPHATVTPGAGETTAQPTVTPGGVGPGPQPSVTPGSGGR